MTLSKLKLCSVEYESATWLAGWQITFYDSATGSFTPLEFKGLTTGNNYQCEESTVSGSILSLETTSRLIDSS